MKLSCSDWTSNPVPMFSPISCHCGTTAPTWATRSGRWHSELWRQSLGDKGLTTGSPVTAYTAAIDCDQARATPSTPPSRTIGAEAGGRPRLVEEGQELHLRRAG